jgi:hypothetical protein
MNRWIVVCGLALAVLTSAVALKNAALGSAHLTIGGVAPAPQLVWAPPPPPPWAPPPPPPVIAQD